MKKITLKNFKKKMKKMFLTERDTIEDLVDISARMLYCWIKDTSAEIDQTLDVFEKTHNEAECMGNRSYRALVEVRGFMELSLERLSDNGVKEAE